MLASSCGNPCVRDLGFISYLGDVLRHFQKTNTSFEKRGATSIAGRRLPLRVLKELGDAVAVSDSAALAAHLSRFGLSARKLSAKRA